MGLLQYTSNEMYSSTDLIRKSKTIYDKISNKEIDKAIILRDGKPSFMLLDFETYEKIMNEYLEMKGSSSLTKKSKKRKNAKKAQENEEVEQKVENKAQIDDQKASHQEQTSEKSEDLQNIEVSEEPNTLVEEQNLQAETNKEALDEAKKDDAVKSVSKKLAVNQDALKEILTNTESHKVPPKEPGSIRQKLKEFWD